MSHSDLIVCENFELIEGGDSDASGVLLTFDLDDIHVDGLGHIHSMNITDNGVELVLTENESSNEGVKVLLAFPEKDKEQILQAFAVIQEKFGSILVAGLNQPEQDGEPVIAFAREMILE